MTRNALAPLGDYFNTAMKAVDDMFNDWHHWPATYKGPKWFMEVGKTNAYTKDGDYVLEVKVPGVKEEEISLTSTKGGNLHLVVTSTESKEQKDRNYEYQEYSSQSFSRLFTLPAEVDGEAEPVAELKNGILTIRCKLIPPLPTPAKEEAKRIAVKKID